MEPDDGSHLQPFFSTYMTNALRIGLVQYKNFGPFESSEVDFSQPGLTGVEGQIAWKPGSNSNGSGKSFLIDGIAWALWGRCLREDYKGDDIVRIGSKGGASVTVHVVGGEHPVRVVRYRNHATFKNRVYVYIADKDVTRGTDIETQAVIDHLLMDFVSAQNSLFFGAREDIKSFFTAPDAQRKLIMDQILGLTLYSEGEKIARRRASQLATVLTPLRENRAKLEGSLATERGMLVSLRDGQDVDDLKFREQLARALVVRCVKAVKRCADRVAEARVDVEFEKGEASESLKVYEDAKDFYWRARSNAEREVRKADDAFASSAALHKRAVSLLSSHEATAGKSCTACGQPLPKGKHEEMLARLQADVTSAAKAILKAQAAHSIASEALEKLIEPVRPVFYDVELALRCLVTEERRHDQMEHRLELAKSEHAHARDVLERATTQVTQLESVIATREHKIAKAIAELGEKERQADLLTFWVEAFGNQGLRSFLIESEITTINKRASTYAQRLLGPGATVKLSATTRLKTSDVQREKLSIEAKVPGCMLKYEGASKGQKRRLDLSLLLAFRDLVADRSVGAFRQFFADELFDGLDQTGTEFVIELLREIADRDCPVVLVTHNLQLKSAVDRIVVVRHEKEYLATVTTGSGKVSGPMKKKLVKV